MTIYLALYILIFISIFVEKYFEHGKKIVFAIISLAIICVVGLRKENMGVDLPGYLKSFNYLSSLSLLEAFQMSPFTNYEKGYVVFNSFFGLFSTNKHLFLFSCALLSFLPVAIFAYNNSKKFSLSMIVYLALPPFLLLYSGLRQSLAIGLCMLSFQFVEKRKLIHFSVMILLAMTFHSSALLFFVVFFLYPLKLDMKKRWLSVLALLIVYVVKKPLFLFLGKILKATPKIDNNGAITLMIFFILIYIFCFIYSKQTEKENGLLNVFWLACFCQMFGSLNSIAIRVGYYFMLALLPLLPITLENANNKYENMCMKIVVVTSFVLAGGYFIYNGSWAQSYPHFWFWE